jgi:Fic family protein
LRRKDLRAEDFTADAPGKLVPSIAGHLTFEPNPLPPLLAYDSALVRKLSEAERALGELAGVGRTLPNPHLLIGPFLRREAVLSSRIEGTVTRLRQLLMFELQPEEEESPPDALEVANYVRALEYGLGRLKDLPVCLRFLLEIHKIVLDGVRGRDKRPGTFRDCQAVIGREHEPIEYARFVPPPRNRWTGTCESSSGS